jgi:glucose-6-phosphate 1-epimerase
MSRQSWFAPARPVRGGVPLCWPWFGPAAQAGLPAHGFARVLTWQLADLRLASDGTCTAVLTASGAGAAGFPHPYALTLRLSFGKRMEIALESVHGAPTAQPIAEALHTYLAVGDVRRVRIHGLEGCAYQDRVATPTPLVQDQHPIVIDAETDLLYEGHRGAVIVDDPVLGRRLRLAKTGSASTVVWNPWIAKAARMPDFGDHEWLGMLCVEAANAGADVVSVAPGASHRIATVIEVL